MDGFFCDGARAIFQLALTVLSRNEEFLLHCSDDGKKTVTIVKYKIIINTFQSSFNTNLLKVDFNKYFYF